jgi:hypothetical protein
MWQSAVKSGIICSAGNPQFMDDESFGGMEILLELLKARG